MKVERPGFIGNKDTGGTFSYLRSLRGACELTLEWVSKNKLSVISNGFRIAGCLDWSFSMATMLDSRIVGFAVFIPGLGLMGASYNLEHPISIKGDSKTSNRISTAEGAVNLLAAGLMYKGLTEDQPVMSLTGLVLVPVGLIATGVHTIITDLSTRMNSNPMGSN